MTTEAYPFLEDDPDTMAQVQNIGDFCREIARQREQDVSDFINLSNIFMRGRKVGKIPTGSSDIAATDRLGDFNYDANYMYLCVDDSGAAWRRITLGSW